MGLEQTTLGGSISIAGIGVHSGAPVRITLFPAPAGTGIQFRRTNLPNGATRTLRAHADHVGQTELCTVLGDEERGQVSTVEHLLAALRGLGVDNAVVSVDGPEMPIMDGSSLPFVQILDRAGRRVQDAPRRYIEILDVIEVVDGDKRATLTPSDAFEVAFEIAFPSKAIGRQRVDLPMNGRAFRAELADCRTFGFLHEVEHLRSIGLARGGSMENAVVIEGDRILNSEGLRRPDEFVRHKALDAIGDLYVLGAPILGRFEGVFAGHGINNQLVRALLAAPNAWRWRTFADPLKAAV